MSNNDKRDPQTSNTTGQQAANQSPGNPQSGAKPSGGNPSDTSKSAPGNTQADRKDASPKGDSTKA